MLHFNIFYYKELMQRHKTLDFVTSQNKGRLFPKTPYTRGIIVTSKRHFGALNTLLLHNVLGKFFDHKMQFTPQELLQLTPPDTNYTHVLRVTSMAHHQLSKQWLVKDGRYRDDSSKKGRQANALCTFANHTSFTCSQVIMVLPVALSSLITSLHRG